MGEWGFLTKELKCFGQKFKVFRKNLKCKFVGEWRVFTGNMKRFSWDNGRFSLENNCFQWDNSHILMTWWEHLCVQLDLSLFKPVWFYVKIKVLMGKCKAFLGEYMFWWVYTDRIWWGPLTEHHDASKMIYICIHCITSVYNTRMYIYIYIIYIYIYIIYIYIHLQILYRILLKLLCNYSMKHYETSTSFLLLEACTPPQSCADLWMPSCASRAFASDFWASPLSPKWSGRDVFSWPNWSVEIQQKTRCRTDSHAQVSLPKVSVQLAVSHTLLSVRARRASFSSWS